MDNLKKRFTLVIIISAILILGGILWFAAAGGFAEESRLYQYLAGVGGVKGGGDKGGKGGGGGDSDASIILSAIPSSSSAISLSWNDDAGETGYLLDRSLSSDSGFTEIASIDKDRVTYIDQNLSAEATYYYQMRSYKQRGSLRSFSPYSNVVSATTLAENVTDPVPPSACANEKQGIVMRDLWTWNNQVATDSAQMKNFFAFADLHAVKTIYIESEALLKNNQAELANFINEADAHCMEVELMFGAADWTYPDWHSYAVSLTEQSVSFANSLTGAKPVGVHYDVEPYVLPEWSTDRNTLLNDYLDLLEKIAAVTAASPLRFSSATPFWLDEQTVSRDGQDLVVSEAVIDTVDIATLMAYRDVADDIKAISCQ